MDATQLTTPGLVEQFVAGMKFSWEWMATLLAAPASIALLVWRFKDVIQATLVNTVTYYLGHQAAQRLVNEEQILMPPSYAKTVKAHISQAAARARRKVAYQRILREDSISGEGPYSLLLMVEKKFFNPQHKQLVKSLREAFRRLNDTGTSINKVIVLYQQEVDTATQHLCTQRDALEEGARSLQKRVDALFATLAAKPDAEEAAETRAEIDRLLPRIAGTEKAITALDKQEKKQLKKLNSLYSKRLLRRFRQLDAIERKEILPLCERIYDSSTQMASAAENGQTLRRLIEGQDDEHKAARKALMLEEFFATNNITTRDGFEEYRKKNPPADIAFEPDAALDNYLEVFLREHCKALASTSSAFRQEYDIHPAWIANLPPPGAKGLSNRVNPPEKQPLRLAV